MKQTVIVLWLISIILLFEGCCPTPKPCPAIPQRCKVPYTPMADVNNTLCDDTDFKCITVKALSNFEAKRNEADTLRVNSSVCQ